jgi:thermitase
MIWAADNGAKVINLSLGGPNVSSIMQDAIDYAWEKGVVVVASAGNNGNSSPNYPAYYSKCIAVAATNQNDEIFDMSSFGDWVDVAAPGVNIISTLPNHENDVNILDYGTLSGTSMASPHVAGLAALVWSTPHGTSNTSTSESRICRQIEGTGTYWVKGRINAYQSVLGGLPEVTTLVPVM